MAWGDNSFPVRFLQGQHATDDRNLALKVFAGEVLAAFDDTAIFADKHQVKSVAGGMRSAQFPKVWKATSEYHSAGKEMLGNDIDTSEITVTIDGLLVAHTALYDVDKKLSHFDVEGDFTRELGAALARTYDKNVARQLVLAARTAADGPFPGGSRIVDAALAADAGTGKYDGKAWIDAIIHANELLFDNDVPEEMPRYCAVPLGVFNAMKYAKDSHGQYLLVDRDFGNSKTFTGRDRTLDVDGVTVITTKRLPSTNETAEASVWEKYRADYSKTKAVLWTPMAAATLKVMDIGLESERDTRRQETFWVAKMLAGHGTLRPECAVEFATA